MALFEVYDALRTTLRFCIIQTSKLRWVMDKCIVFTALVSAVVNLTFARTVNRYLLLILILIAISATAFGQEAVDYEQFMYNTPKQIDCQLIKLDESEYKGGKLRFKTVCFYEVKVVNRTLVMWHNINDDSTGFVNQP
jgi:hypothetical protein